MKLLQINVTANWGSTGKIAEQIGLSALSEKWQSYIAYGRNYNRSSSKLIKVGRQLDVYLHYIKQRIFDNEGLASKRATRQLIKTISEISPDIVQLHNIHDHYLNYKILFGYLSKTDIKVVWTFHDCWAFTGHCFHFVSKNCDKWKSKCEDCPLKHIYPNTLFDNSKRNFLLKKILFGEFRNLTIVSCSAWMNDLVNESFFKDTHKLIIHNGIDLGVFRPLPVKDNKENRTLFSLLFVSNLWNESKGFNDIEKLYSKLDETYQITVVGLSKKQISQMPKSINCLERTNSVEELVELYSKADVFINPTYADTFPTVNIESLACGTPVITYRTGGAPETIDENTGIVVEQGNVDEIVEALNLIKNTSGKFTGQQCRNRAEVYFDKKKCFGKYIDLYRNLTDK